ncbi:MAG: hypothetical protein L0L78_08985 [Tetragenococcus koreensis]|nr:hypothetical protein [Tetragenococcus koreensis]MDN6735740.1 hypothetical protein [Tetragenococcus koreensis]MDN6836838.1 hypothetical protein [Lactococcus lactis]
MMFKTIFRTSNNPLDPTYLQQRIIDFDEPVPKGWTANKEDIAKPEWDNEETIDKPGNVEVYPNTRSANINAE